MKTLLTALSGLIVLACAFPVAAASRTVSPAELATAFKVAACGDELLVTPGQVPPLRVKALTRDCSANPIVITAADPSDRPVFTTSITLDAWAGVAIRGVVIDLRGAPVYHMAGLTTAGGVSKAITFEENEVFGRSEPTVNISGALVLEGMGYGVNGTFDGFTIRRNLFHDLAKGVVLIDSSRGVVEDNDLVRITTDGIQFGGLVDARISRNLIDKAPLPEASRAHPDCVQGLLGSRPSSRVIIADNLCRSPATGKAHQAIFMGDDYASTDITVTRNLSLDAAYWAMKVGGQSAYVTHNVALSQRTDANSAFDFKSVAGTVTGNTAGAFSTMPAGTRDLNAVAPRSTAAEIDAAEARWMAKFRPSPSSLDPR